MEEHFVLCEVRKDYVCKYVYIYNVYKMPIPVAERWRGSAAGRLL